MTLDARLRQLADALPPSGSVVLTRADLLAMLAEEAGGEGPREEVTDYTVRQVATMIGRQPPTVRNWCREGRLPGAYLLRGKTYRIPRAALEAFRAAQAAGEKPSSVRSVPVDLGEWRKHVRS